MRDEKLLLDYRRFDDEIIRTERMGRDSNDDFEVYLPERNSINELEKNVLLLHSKAQALAEPDEVFSIMKSHFSDYIGGVKAHLKPMYERPSRYIHGLLYSYTYYAKQDRRSDVERADIATKRLLKTKDVLIAINTLLDHVPAVYLQELFEGTGRTSSSLLVEAERLDTYFPMLSSAQKAELHSAIIDSCRLLDVFESELKLLLQNKGIKPVGLTSDDDNVGLDEAEYRSILWDGLGVDLDQLLSWYEDEIQKTRSEVLEIGSRLKISESAPKTMAEANAILLKYAGPAGSPEEMFARANAYIKRTKAACQDFCYLPEGEDCRVVPVPEQLKLSYPWGGYGGGDPERRPLLGEMFLNNYNFKAVTDGWIKINTVHEAYPGHHVQFLRAAVDPLPETIKRGAKSVPITEGTPHRSERLFEFVFPEDQFYPLFVAYRRHHTSVRIKADLMLRYFGNPIKDVVKLYMDELDFDKNTARGQVNAQESMQGYFTTYYYGMKKLADLEKAHGYDKKAYTELLFAAGRVSIETFERFLKLDEAGKQSYKNDFKSIEQFGV